MRVLVTGATGFLGGRVARLLADGHRVTGLGRRLAPEAAVPLHEAGVEVVRHDLVAADDRAALDRLLDEHDAVVHCAAMSTLWGRWDDLRAANVDASARVARGCAERGLRLVHISSPSIYNRVVYESRRDRSGAEARLGTADQPVAETLPVGPRFDSDYARSKWLAERVVLAAHPNACVLRPRGLYGPGDTTVMPRVVDPLRAGRLPRLVDEEVVTDLTHVDNAAHAVALALTSGVAGPVNIADGEPIAIWAGIDEIADALGVPRPRLRLPARAVEVVAAGVEAVARRLPGRPEPRLTATGIRLLTRGMRLDLTRARTELGYAPVTTGGLGAVIAQLADG